MVTKILTGGASGAKLEVYNSSNKMVVRKNFYTNIEREKANLKKHLGFVGCKGWSAPKIIRDCLGNNQPSIDLDFIHGPSVANIVASGNKLGISRVADNITNLLSFFKLRSAEKNLDIIKINNKYDQIIGNINDQIMVEAIIKTRPNLNSGTLKIYEGPCHGDLTFSNIIQDEESGDYYLIDFLDVFYSTIYQDYVKILQDAYYGWSYRFDLESNKLSYMISGNYLLNRLKNNGVNFESYPVLIFEHLCLARIAPYVADEVTKKWLINSLEKFKKKSLINKII